MFQISYYIHSTHRVSEGKPRAAAAARSLAAWATLRYAQAEKERAAAAARGLPSLTVVGWDAENNATRDRPGGSAAASLTAVRAFADCPGAEQ